MPRYKGTRAAQFSDEATYQGIRTTEILNVDGENISKDISSIKSTLNEHTTELKLIRRVGEINIGEEVSL